MTQRKSILMLVVVLAAGLLVIGTPVFSIGEEGTTNPPESNRMKIDHAPTPFSAAKIRDACNDGRMIKSLQEIPGKADTFSMVLFLKGDNETSHFKASTLDVNGKLTGQGHTAKVKWKDLQAHASFPASGTRISSESKTTPAGTFDCWLYVVTTKKNNNTEITKYWFAKSMPGPPVYLEQMLDGKIVFKLTMVKSGKKS
ncbi:MAG: hypothetical protein GY940_02320 [bacterium]|nr:hypothetical protein [bacterium]